MYRYSCIALFLIFFGNTILSHAQTTSVQHLSASMGSDPERNIEQDRASWIEQPEARTPFSSTFLTPDHRTIVHYSKEPLNYLKNGSLVPVDYSPVAQSDGLLADNQPFAVSVNKAGEVIISNEAHSAPLVHYSTSCFLNGTAASPKNLQQQGNQAIIPDFFPGVDKTFDFHFNAVEYNYVLNRLPVVGSNDLIFEESILLPPGAKVVPDQNLGSNTAKGWAGALSIRAADNSEIGHIRGAVCLDANKSICTATYQVQNKDGAALLKIIVPNHWLSSSTRVFPITVDPLVTGPTATWGGSYIPSCLAPSFSSDSILVTIPAGISVTGCFVSGSYYADPFTPALMSDGVMKFSTSCNTSSTFTVAPPTGSTPGTAYLTNYDLRSPLLCCFPQSCSAQTFYLSMHIQRAVLGTGCNITYLYHDPFSGYPFSCYIEGHSIESYGLEWNVAPNSYCSDVCNVNGTVYMRYGVPPYTITHPWAAGPLTAGSPAGCSYGTISKVVPLTLPNCPWICDTVTMLSVPPPTVVDACGTVLTGLPNKIILIKEKPVVSSTPDPAVVCPDMPFSIGLNACVTGATLTWSGNGISGTNDTINDVIGNTTGAPSTTDYIVTAVASGCTSNPDTIHVTTNGIPTANFNVSSPVIINTPASFTDASVAHGGSVAAWFWDFGDGSTASTQNPSHAYAVPGVYQVCLGITTSDGCLGRECIDVTVIPAELVLPNVITPNGDNQNDVLYFKYLEFFGKNSLKVYDRWGKMVYEKENYTNDWNAKNCADGTYFYTLETGDGKSYPGYVQIIHQ